MPTLPPATDPQFARRRSMTKSMGGDVQRGLDYTPLYKFLLKNVGRNWDEVASEASPRISNDEPLYHLLDEEFHSDKGTVRVGDNSYFSALFVDEDGVLQMVAPDLSIEELYPSCSCCTHSFNGERFVNTEIRYNQT